MQLNHLDLSVPDVASAVSFFEAGFGFTLLQTKGNDGMAILRGDCGFVLVLTRAQQTDRPLYPKTFHIGFLLASEQAVMDAYLRIEVAGINLPSPPRAVRGSLMFYCHAPGGILVEVSHRTAV
jgi:catechol 2,3-dioxygenase-like lactoylglutathione lyase family enzyme